MTIPKKVKRCPILEAVTELRFETDTPADAIYGMIYKEFQKEYPQTNTLPIIQLPEPIRLQDPDLRYKPYYQMQNNDFIIQIGPRAVSLVNKKEYKTWKVYSKMIHELFRNLIDVKIIKNIERLGIRYINFFNDNIFDHLKLSITMDGASFLNKEIFLRTRIESGIYSTNLQISNAAQIQNKTGSIVDLDTYLENYGKDFIKDLDKLLVGAHDEEKKIFYGILKEDFVASLEPEY